MPIEEIYQLEKSGGKVRSSVVDDEKEDVWRERDASTSGIAKRANGSDSRNSDVCDEKIPATHILTLSKGCSRCKDIWSSRNWDRQTVALVDERCYGFL